jgi:hypothetical protein
VKPDSWGGMFQSAGLPWRDVLGSNLHEVAVSDASRNPILYDI